MGHVSFSISMAFTKVENVMAVGIGGLVMTEGTLVVLKTLLHRLLSGLVLRGFLGHFGDIVCVSGD
jgi:hypothetical protein